MKTKYKEGDRVIYWQPGVDGILASWSGKASNDGEEVEATIKEVKPSGYYITTEGMMLNDSDIRRLA
jgi:hypothetical protein